MYSSDHFPIIISIHLRNNTNRMSLNKIFLLNLANWEQFHSLVDEELEVRPQSLNINKETALITKAIRTAANKSIPQSSLKKKTNVPWWNKKLARLREDKKSAWYTFKSSPTTSNLIQYKKCNALFKREMKASKAICCEKFTSQINRIGLLELYGAKYII